VNDLNSNTGRRAGYGPGTVWVVAAAAFLLPYFMPPLRFLQYHNFQATDGSGPQQHNCSYAKSAPISGTGSLHVSLI
jgi:hypothetical protein